MKQKFIDGVDHINIYSKGKTELGRFLSNFAYSPIETEDGHFDSIEGYWYWIGSQDDKLRYLSGWQAKKYGRSIGVSDWIDGEEFKNKIKKAIEIKLKNNPKYLSQLQSLSLPLKHYYVYENKIVHVPKAKWFVDYLESFKQNKIF